MERDERRGRGREREREMGRQGRDMFTAQINKIGMEKARAGWGTTRDLNKHRCRKKK